MPYIRFACKQCCASGSPDLHGFPMNVIQALKQPVQLRQHMCIPCCYAVGLYIAEEMWC